MGCHCSAVAISCWYGLHKNLCRCHCSIVPISVGYGWPKNMCRCHCGTVTISVGYGWAKNLCRCDVTAAISASYNWLKGTKCHWGLQFGPDSTSSRLAWLVLSSLLSSEAISFWLFCVLEVIDCRMGCWSADTWIDRWWWLCGWVIAWTKWYIAWWMDGWWIYGWI